MFFASWKIWTTKKFFFDFFDNSPRKLLIYKLLDSVYLRMPVSNYYFFKCFKFFKYIFQIIERYWILYLSFEILNFIIWEHKKIRSFEVISFNFLSYNVLWSGWGYDSDLKRFDSKYFICCYCGHVYQIYCFVIEHIAARLLQANSGVGVFVFTHFLELLFYFGFVKKIFPN